MKMRSAIVFGASGFIGESLIDELCLSNSYDLIKIFVRNKTLFSGKDKIKEVIIDFNRLAEYSDMIMGDDLFICLGTTIKKAGSVRKMEEIDRDLPIRIASIAYSNGVRKMAVVSSIGADPKSSNYYLRIKGEMEQGIMDFDFDTIAVARPSILLGDRKEKRTGENAAKVLAKLFGILFIGKMRKYRGIEGKDVAKAMIRLISEKSGKEIFEFDKLKEFSKQ